MCNLWKFLYFWGRTHIVSPLRFSSFPHVYLFILLQFLSPIIVTASRTSADTHLIFPEKRRGLAPFAWLLFSHEYITAIQLFSSLHSAVYNDIATATKYLRNTLAGAASTARWLVSSDTSLRRSVYVKGAYSSLEYALRRLRLLTLSVRIIADSLSKLISQFVWPPSDRVFKPRSFRTRFYCLFSRHGWVHNIVIVFIIAKNDEIYSTFTITTLAFSYFFFADIQERSFASNCYNVLDKP